MNLATRLSLIGLLLVTPLRLALAADAAHNFEKWETDIAAFEAANRTNPPPTNAVLFIGSSTIRLSDKPGEGFSPKRASSIAALAEIGDCGCHPLCRPDGYSVCAAGDFLSRRRQ